MSTEPGAIDPLSTTRYGPQAWNKRKLNHIYDLKTDLLAAYIQQFYYCSIHSLRFVYSFCLVYCTEILLIPELNLIWGPKHILKGQRDRQLNGLSTRLCVQETLAPFPTSHGPPSRPKQPEVAPPKHHLVLTPKQKPTFKEPETKPENNEIKSGSTCTIQDPWLISQRPKIKPLWQLGHVRNLPALLDIHVKPSDFLEKITFISPQRSFEVWKSKQTGCFSAQKGHFLNC